MLFHALTDHVPSPWPVGLSHRSGVAPRSLRLAPRDRRHEPAIGRVDREDGGSARPHTTIRTVREGGGYARPEGAQPAQRIEKALTRRRSSGERKPFLHKERA